MPPTAAPNLGATITTHHLIINRNHILVGGIKPHYYCLPVAKREHHRLALRRAATSGKACYFLGTDSAPHVDALKEHACGCAGCFTATNTMALLAHVFEEEGALDRLEAFASLQRPGVLPPAGERGHAAAGQARSAPRLPGQDLYRGRPRHRLRPRLSGALACGKLISSWQKYSPRSVRSACEASGGSIWTKMKPQRSSHDPRQLSRPKRKLPA